MADRSRGEVLLVIVDHTEQVSLAVALQKWGYWVTVTSGFREAHERLDRHPPRVLISDVRLGVFNGLHLAVLASHLPTTAAILLDRTSMRYVRLRRCNKGRSMWSSLLTTRNSSSVCPS